MAQTFAYNIFNIRENENLKIFDFDGLNFNVSPVGDLTSKSFSVLTLA